MAPGDKLEKALSTLVGKLTTMDKFGKTAWARSAVVTFVFVLDYDWDVNGSPGTVAERGGYQPMLSLLANAGTFTYSKDSVKKGTKVYALQGDEDTFVDFITQNDQWSSQNLDEWELLSGGPDKKSQEKVGIDLDSLTWAAYQVDGDKGIKAQVAKLGLTESGDDFLKIYFSIRAFWDPESDSIKNSFVSETKPGEIYDFVIKGEKPDPVRLRMNLGDGSVAFDVKKDTKAKLTYATDDATFHKTILGYKKKVADPEFASGKIQVTPKPTNQAEKDWAAYLYDHFASYFNVFGRNE
ncbi:uncharacterized protein LOC62_02G002698 [Vanrija pseudolonga]|uniref:Uncharacterized protein n=1 Tax=Vanrija pseudolonga TaxID=143232 RepID=A0AAF0Y907_9TREE|nr:hypothetical protein LOC62_02G002698 [Vanrija pseudolonga]